MCQCVPSLEMEEENSKVEFQSTDHSINSFNSLLLDVPKLLNCNSVELTWDDGLIAMHDIDSHLVGNKPQTEGTLESIVNQATEGTLESIVNQATKGKLESIVNQATEGTLESIVNQAIGVFAVDGDGDITADWVNPAGATIPAITTDVVVPCEPSTHVQDSCNVAMGINSFNTNLRMNESAIPAINTDFFVPCEPSTHVQDSCNVAMGINSFNTNLRMNESATCEGTDTLLQLTLDTWERELCGTSMPMPSQDFSKTSAHDHFISHTNNVQEASDRKAGDEEGKTKSNIGKSSSSLKRSRAAIHNQSERKRRDKINQRMKTLQKMVPNSSKSNKVSMLDEVIDYLKQLQDEVHLMNMRTNLPSIILPLPLQQQLQMSMMGMGTGMGMGVMDMNAINRAVATVVPPVISPAATVVSPAIPPAATVVSPVIPPASTVVSPIIPPAATVVPPVIPPAATVVPSVIPPAAAFMPTTWDNPVICLPTLPAGSVMPDPLTALLARQSQPMTIDAYIRLLAMYQQTLQQPPA